MSPSPAQPEHFLDDEYRAGWRAITRLIQEGGSWSGRERNTCFLNLGNNRFADVSAVSGLDFPDDARAAAVVDWDLDGALDLWVTNRTGPRLRFMRNVAQATGRFVAVRLVGQTTNRDAVGARVELHVAGTDDANERTLIKTVRAGDGYLAQSSKWLHFGLGRDGVPKRLVVRWPGEGVEEFRGLEAGRWYHVRQGSARAEAWTPPRPAEKLAAAMLEAPPVSGRAAVLLGAPLPLPWLRYLDADGEVASADDGDEPPAPASSRASDRHERASLRQVAVRDRHEGPLLVLVWASWCPPCTDELRALTEHRDRIRRAGVALLALSVDEAADRQAARAFLEDIDWPFAAGFAHAETLEALDSVQRALLDRRRPLPLPSSFLLDDRFRLTAIYRGPVTAERLAADVGKLNAGPAERRRAAVPFDGRWYHAPHDADLVGMAEELAAAGHGDIAGEYLAQALARAGGEQALAAAATADPRFANAQYNLGVALMAAGKLDEAVAAFERVLVVDADHWRAHSNLGVALAGLGRHVESVPHFAALVRLRPDYWKARTNLGLALAAAGHHAEAAQHFEQILHARPELDHVHVYLGRSLLALGRFGEAREHFEALRGRSAGQPEGGRPSAD